jgi:hypothetical protein
MKVALLEGAKKKKKYIKTRLSKAALKAKLPSLSLTSMPSIF